MPDIRNDLEGELLSITGQTTNFDGDWVCLRRQLDHGGANIPYRVTITGTCTVTLEGRNSPNEPAVVVRTDAASNSVTVVPYRQFRMRISAITGSVDVRGSFPYTIRKAA